jgi:hypothetical protein
LAAALNEGVVTLEDRLDFEGRFFYADQTLHDNQVYQGVLTLREGFAKASSIALAKTGLKLGPTLAMVVAARLSIRLGRISGAAQLQLRRWCRT